jgi:hypothetical protein
VPLERVPKIRIVSEETIRMRGLPAARMWVMMAGEKQAERS